MSIRAYSCSAAGTQNSRAHIYYMYPSPKHFQTIFISILCPPPLSSQNIFKLFSARFCVLPTKHFPDSFISVLFPSPPVFVSEHAT